MDTERITVFTPTGNKSFSKIQELAQSFDEQDGVWCSFGEQTLIIETTQQYTNTIADLMKQHGLTTIETTAPNYLSDATSAVAEEFCDNVRRLLTL